MFSFSSPWKVFPRIEWMIHCDKQKCYSLPLPIRIESQILNIWREIAFLRVRSGINIQFCYNPRADQCETFSRRELSRTVWENGRWVTGLNYLYRMVIWCFDSDVFYFMELCRQTCPWLYLFTGLFDFFQWSWHNYLKNLIGKFLE